MSNRDSYLTEEKPNARERIVEDLKYIKNEIIAQQKDGNYCKWSRMLHAVSIVGMTERQMIEYWRGQYKHYKRYQMLLENACIDKLHNDLISSDEMIEMIKNSNDFEIEKEKAIIALGGTYKRKGR